MADRERARRLAVAAAVPWAVWAAVRTAGAERGLPLVPAMAFTPYAAAGLVLPAVAAVRARSSAAALLTAASVAGFTAALAGRLTGRPPAGPPPPGPRLRLATVNLRLGLADPHDVVALARDVDVLSIQELTRPAHAALLDAGLGDVLPTAHVVHARAGSPPGAGGGIWTRLPVTGRATVPGSFEQPTTRLAVPGALDVEVTAVHTRPPARSAGDVRDWTADVRALPPAAGRDAGDVLRVLAGDFNATPDHALFRALLRRGYTDAGLRSGAGLRTTWTPHGRPLPRLVLDHVLVDRRVTVTGYRVVRVRGTDHRAVVVDLALPSAAAPRVPM